jgi:hypothetical protein
MNTNRHAARTHAHHHRPTRIGARSMTTNPTRHPAIPDPAQRQARNAALAATGTETGFWDDHGRPAPWPDDIDDWTPTTSEPRTHEPGEPPF